MINDDLATARHPYDVIACIPVHGRLPLLPYTIRRLLTVNGCSRVICSGDGLEEKRVCEAAGAVWVHHRNKPLGAKWNAAFRKAKEFNPDACLFVGSSDWISDNWIWKMMSHVDKHGFAGMAGCYLVDVGEQLRLCYWPGYKGYRVERADETIGIGRMLSRRLLDALAWHPFESNLPSSLDRSMKDRSMSFGFNDFMVEDPSLKALSISTPHWPNKHVFEMHYGNHPHNIPSEILEPEPFISINFPEINSLCESLKATSVSR